LVESSFEIILLLVFYRDSIAVRIFKLLLIVTAFFLLFHIAVLFGVS
jgi:hypothetical protein